MEKKGLAIGKTCISLIYSLHSHNNVIWIKAIGLGIGIKCLSPLYFHLYLSQLYYFPRQYWSKLSGIYNNRKPINNNIVFFFYNTQLLFFFFYIPIYTAWQLWKGRFFSLPSMIFSLMWYAFYIAHALFLTASRSTFIIINRSDHDATIILHCNWETAKNINSGYNCKNINSGYNCKCHVCNLFLFFWSVSLGCNMVVYKLGLLLPWS